MSATLQRLAQGASSAGSIAAPLRGMHLVIRLMGLLRQDDYSALKASAELEVDHDLCMKWLHSMSLAGLAHVKEWIVAASGKGKRQAVFRFGAGESARPPSGVLSSRRPAMANLASLRALWDAIEEPCTRQELAAPTGLATGTIRRYVIAMHSEKLIRICGYLPRPEGVGGVWIEQFAQGSAPDAARPKPRPSYVHSRAYYRRQKAANNAGAVLAKAWGLSAAAA